SMGFSRQEYWSGVPLPSRWLCYISFLLHISHFMFFANDLLLAFYFIFILEYGNAVRQKANSSDFLEFKMGHKAAETARNINSAFGSGTANKHTVQWWFKKFCKGN
ncbi:hypothetical protein ABQD47_22825, partial [Providencia rettgeri]